MSDALKVAVVGVGHLGKWHAEKYAALADCELVAVVDTDLQTAAAIATQHGATAYRNYREIIPLVDAISLVVPTSLHYKIALDFLKAGIHCFIEKPITETIAEAEALINIAASQNLVLQVGHIERFNAVLNGMMEHLNQPRFIESTRLAPFTLRATDVSVVHDLMIHDIDIVLYLINSPISHISASGISVLSNNIDIGNARIEFENGCVANVTASRISQKRERRLRVFQKDSYLSADLQNRVLAVNRKGETCNPVDIPDIAHEEHQFNDNDALNMEIVDFVDAIRLGRSPRVNGEDGRRALATAIAIIEQMREQA